VTITLAPGDAERRRAPLPVGRVGDVRRSGHRAAEARIEAGVRTGSGNEARNQASSGSRLETGVQGSILRTSVLAEKKHFG
jgi:hypothetical protein